MLEEKGDTRGVNFCSYFWLPNVWNTCSLCFVLGFAIQVLCIKRSSFSLSVGTETNPLFLSGGYIGYVDDFAVGEDCLQKGFACWCVSP